MPETAKKLIINLLLPVLCALVAVGLDRRGVFDGFNRVIYDVLLQRRSRLPSVDKRLMVIAIDDKTISEMAEQVVKDRSRPDKPADLRTTLAYPIQRRWHGRMLSALRQAKAARTVWDFIFDAPQDEEHENNVMAEGMAKTPTVLALSGRRLTPGDPVLPPTREHEQVLSRFQVGPPGTARDWNVPIITLHGKDQSQATILEAAHGAGQVADSTDPDGVYRRVPLVVRVGDKLLPHMSLATVLDILGVPRHDLEMVGRQTLRIGGKTLEHPIDVPLDEHGYMLINYAPKWQHNTEIDVRSYVEQLGTLTGWPDDAEGFPTDKEVVDALGGKTIFFGETMSGSGDFVAIPTDPEHQVPGVLVSFNAVNTMLTGQFLTPAPPWVRWALTFGTAIPLGLVFWPRSPVRSSAAAAGILAAIVGSSVYAFYGRAYVLPMAAPVFGGVMTVMGVVGISHLREYMRAAKVATILSRFVSPALLRELDRSGTQKKLPPVKRIELSIMFCDLAGFTSLSERTEPGDIAAFLVRFYELALEVLFRNHGTLDKLLGDGILAYWGAPDRLEEKEAWAARAALELQRRFGVLSDELKQKGWGELKIRCGITTGSVSAGYLGGARHAAYTIVGRSVNVASRLESNATPGTIVVDRPTADRIKADFELNTLPPIHAKGVEKPVDVWQVVDERRYNHPDAVRESKS
jgi:adenylate cyclase